MAATPPGRSSFGDAWPKFHTTIERWPDMMAPPTYVVVQRGQGYGPQACFLVKVMAAISRAFTAPGPPNILGVREILISNIPEFLP